MREDDKMSLATPDETIKSIQQHNIRFKKKLGQNFLIDMHVINKIIRAAGTGGNVLEIGSGIGNLTEQLCKVSKKVVAVEIDNDLIQILSSNLISFDNVQIINGDFTKLDIAELSKKHFNGESFKVVANLPYYITAKIIDIILMHSSYVDSITAMVQKEVAEKILAKQGAKNYSLFAAVVAFYGDSYLVANVPLNCFIPRPDVSSAVINIKMHNRYKSIADEKTVLSLMKAAFGQRRKTLLNSIGNQLDICADKEALQGILESCGFEQSRGEQLSVEDFCKLAGKLAEVQ